MFRVPGTAHTNMVKTANFVFSIFYHNNKKLFKKNKAWLSHWTMKSVSGRGFLVVSSFSEGTQWALGTGSQHRGGSGHKGCVKFMLKKTTFSGTRVEVDVY